MSSELRRLSTDSLDFGSDAILVFSCIRDEALRLPWLIEYYRQAGVSHFFFVDNNSSDGSTDYLLSQADVTVYHTDASYAESLCGVLWLNELLARHGPGHWTLTVDADELLVYPACERVDLAGLSGYLDTLGADALLTMLLDMYSDRSIGETEYTPGQPFLEACPYFDSDTYALEDGYPVATRGGPRERAFWGDYDRDHPSPFLPKIPLVRWRTGLEYEASTHLISGVTTAELTGALLHFKFFADFPGRAALEADRGEHFADARQYKAYSSVLSRNPDLALLTDSSTRYRNSLQLVELGLLSIPESYRFFAGLDPEG